MALCAPFAIKIFWSFGFSISIAGLIFQALIYYLIPCSRKLDQKILTQLTIARILNIALEYVVTCVIVKNTLNDIVFALYLQTDAALICWMFIFTKNLYDSVTNVFAPKSSFTLMSVIIWCVTIPIGLLCPLVMEMDHNRSGGRSNEDVKDKYFDYLYTIYAYVKFIVLGVNLVLFSIIFKTAISRKDRSVSLLRTCVVSFTLVSISSVQVLVTDLFSNFMNEYPKVSVAFGVINSYQVIVLTLIFAMLVQSSSNEESLRQKITKKFVRQTV